MRIQQRYIFQSNSEITHPQTKLPLLPVAIITAVQILLMSYFIRRKYNEETILTGVHVAK